MTNKRAARSLSLVAVGMLATIASASAVAVTPDAYLKGTFQCVGYKVIGGSSQPQGKQIIATFDGSGNVSTIDTTNLAGVITSSSSTATYSVGADGTVSIGSIEPVVGALSADGNVLFLTDLTASSSPAITVCDRHGAVLLMNNPSGILALNSNTTGNFNNAAGFNALFANTTGSNNNAQGSNALAANTTGYGNSAMGANSLINLTTGFRNAAVGNNTGGSLIVGSYNVDIGWGVSGAADEIGVVRIGNPSFAQQTVIAGINNSTVTGAQVYVTAGGRLGVLASSERYKTDIQSLSTDSEKLQQLRPVSFHLKSEPNGALQYGLIAEEVNKVYPELVIRDEQGEIQGVRYDELAPMLLNELQQQRRQLAAQDAKLAAQAEQLTAMKSQLTEVETLRAQVAELRSLATVIAARRSSDAGITEPLTLVAMSK